MYTEERIEALRDAQKHIQTAMTLLKDAVSGTEIEAAVERTLLAELETCVGNDHQWLSHQDNNLEELIEHYEHFGNQCSLCGEQNDSIDKDQDICSACEREQRRRSEVDNPFSGGPTPEDPWCFWVHAQEA